MGPEKSHQLLSIRIIQKRPCYKENFIHKTFCKHHNWLFMILCVYFWSSRFGHIFWRPIINSWLNQTSPNFSVPLVPSKTSKIGSEDCHDKHVLYLCMETFDCDCLSHSICNGCGNVLASVQSHKTICCSLDLTRFEPNSRTLKGFWGGKHMKTIFYRITVVLYIYSN